MSGYRCQRLRPLRFGYRRQDIHRSVSTRGSRQGAKRFVTLGRHGVITVDEARTRARAVLGEVASGKDPAAERAKAALAPTLADLVRLFLDEHVIAKRKARTAESYKTVLRKHLVPKFGAKAIDQLHSTDLSRLHLAMANRPAQANRLMAVIGSMYAFAAKRGLVPKGMNPASDVERFRTMSRERYLSAAELKRLGTALVLAETTGLPWVLPTMPAANISRRNRTRSPSSRKM